MNETILLSYSQLKNVYQNKPVLFTNSVYLPQVA